MSEVDESSHPLIQKDPAPTDSPEVKETPPSVDVKPTTGAPLYKRTRKYLLKAAKDVTKRRIPVVVLCIFMHLVMLGAYITLVVISTDGQPVHTFVMGHVLSWMYTKAQSLGWMITATQVVKAYNIALLFVTQKLALRRNLIVEQTITATHDEASAWSGIPQSLGSLWGQRVVKTKPFTLFCIFAYLAAIFSSEINAPRLFTGQGIHYNNALQFHNITASLASVGNDTWSMEYAFPALSVLPLINWVVLPPAGLSGGAIYDMPQAYKAATNVYLEVNAVNTSVSCKAMTGVQQVGSPDSRGLYLFRLAPTIKDVYLALPCRALMIVPLVMADANVTAPTTIIVASTFRVTDDDTDTVEGVVSLNPPVTPVNFGNLNCPSSIKTVQFLACDMQFVQQQARVVPGGGIVDPTQAPPTRRNVSWADWNPVTAPINKTLSVISTLGNYAPLGADRASYEVNINGTQQGNLIVTHTYSIFESTLMQMGGAMNNVYTGITLGLLEILLEQSIALVFWRAAYNAVLLNEAKDVSWRTNNNSPPEFLSQIDPEAAIVGLALASAMFLIATYLVWQPSDAPIPPHGDLKEPGVLQILWLAGDLPDVTEKLQTELGDKEPSLKNMRIAGTHMTVKLRDKNTHEDSEDDTDSDNDDKAHDGHENV